MSTNPKTVSSQQGLAVGSVICGFTGILVMLGTWLGGVETIGMIVGLVAGICGIILATTARKRGQNPRLTQTGLIASIISLAGAAIMLILIFALAGLFLAGFVGN